MDTQQPTEKPSVKISARIPKDLHAVLVQRAKRYHSSVTGELVYLAELGLQQVQSAPDEREPRS
jgi:hypothetical protein